MRLEPLRAALFPLALFLAACCSHPPPHERDPFRYRCPALPPPCAEVRRERACPCREVAQVLPPSARPISPDMGKLARGLHPILVAPDGRLALVRAADLGGDGAEIALVNYLRADLRWDPAVAAIPLADLRAVPAGDERLGGLARARWTSPGARATLAK